MELGMVLAELARRQGIDVPQQSDGRYRIGMEGVELLCFESHGKICLLANIARSSPSAAGEAESRRLLDKSLAVVREYRASLTLDEQSGYYQLSQRFAAQGVTVDSLTTLLQEFGGCCLYYKELFSQNSPPPVRGTVSF